MSKVFLDANVLFTAAHNPRGKAAFLIGLPKKGHLRIVTSTFAVEEAQRNIELKYPDRLSALKSLLREIDVIPSGDGALCAIALPEKDKPIFESACRCKATHLLTGDLKDFGRYMNRPNDSEGVLIQTVGEFIDSL